MKRFFSDSKTINRFRSGPLGVHIQELTDELAEQGFTKRSVRRQIRRADHFGCWLRRRGIPISIVTFDHASRYVARHGRIREGDAQALTRVLDILARRGIVARPEGTLPKTPLEPVVDRYVEYLQGARVLAAPTIVYYRRFATDFLARRFGDGPVTLSSIQAKEVFAFVQHEASRMSSQSAKNVTTVLRSFLRYARFCGVIDRDLSGAVPTVASWSLGGIPKVLTRHEVNRVLASCNRRTKIGRRDYAILLLLARLGLRSCEVASLSLDDIDGVAGTLAIRGKDGKLCKMPLPQDVGQAIATYLRKARPPVSTRRVFLRVTAPIVGFKTHQAVGLIAKYALV